MTPRNPASALGDLLESKRKELGLRSEAALAKRMEMSRQQLNLAKKKLPKIGTLRRIAKGIEMTLLELLTRLDVDTESARGPTEQPGRGPGATRKARKG